MTIGIIGCEPGTGVTHLAIALAGFCGSKLRKKTAYLECHSRNEISQLQTEMNLTSSAKADDLLPCFKIHDVDYYPRVTSHDLPLLMNQGYVYLILDLGYLGESDFQEFLRCDKKLVLGSLSPWKVEKYREFFRAYHSLVNLGEGFYYFIQMGNTIGSQKLLEHYHLSMRSVPFISNPFRIHKELFPFLKELVS